MIKKSSLPTIFLLGFLMRTKCLPIIVLRGGVKFFEMASLDACTIETVKRCIGLKAASIKNFFVRLEYEQPYHNMIITLKYQVKIEPTNLNKREFVFNPSIGFTKIATRQEFLLWGVGLLY